MEFADQCRVHRVQLSGRFNVIRVTPSAGRSTISVDMCRLPPLGWWVGPHPFPSGDGAANVGAALRRRVGAGAGHSIAARVVARTRTEFSCQTPGSGRYEELDMGLRQSAAVDVLSARCSRGTSVPVRSTGWCRRGSRSGSSKRRQSLRDGKAVLRLPGGVRWVAQHGGYEPPRRFVDELVSLPLRWRHTHGFEPLTDSTTLVTDVVETPVPGPSWCRRSGIGTGSSWPTWPPTEPWRRCVPSRSRSRSRVPPVSSAPPSAPS